MQTFVFPFGGPFAKWLFVSSSFVLLLYLSVRPIGEQVVVLASVRLCTTLRDFLRRFDSRGGSRPIHSRQHAVCSIYRFHIIHRIHREFTELSSPASRSFSNMGTSFIRLRRPLTSLRLSEFHPSATGANVLLLWSPLMSSFATTNKVLEIGFRYFEFKQRLCRSAAAESRHDSLLMTPIALCVRPWFWFSQISPMQTLRWQSPRPVCQTLDCYHEAQLRLSVQKRCQGDTLVALIALVDRLNLRSN